MINLTEADIGRKVIYLGNRYPGGKIEEGVITSFNSHTVFVRYADSGTSKGTSRQDLEWLTPDAAKHPADGLGEIFTSDEYNQANRE